MAGHPLGQPASVLPDPPTGKRLPAAERRRQLIGIGLQLLTERPLGEITVEEVSRRAGISRGLLFNYFPTRRDYHLAIIRAAMRRMSRIAEPPEGVATTRRRSRSSSSDSWPSSSVCRDRRGDHPWRGR